MDIELVINYLSFSNISNLFACLKRSNHALFCFKLELSGELDLKSHIEIALLISSFDWHAFIIDELASLRGNLFINCDCQGTTIESSESAGYAFECLLKADSLRKDQVMAISAVAIVCQLLEFDDKI